MGSSISSEHLNAEQKSWNSHQAMYDESRRREYIKIFRTMRLTSAALSYSTNQAMFGLTYDHYFISLNDGERFVEFQGDSNSRSCVALRLERFTDSKVLASTKSVSDLLEIQKRALLLLGMTNYSLGLRNCEHVARYIYYGTWESSQVNDASDSNAFGYMARLSGFPTEKINSKPYGLGFVDEGDMDEKGEIISGSSSEYKLKFLYKDDDGSRVDKNTIVVVILGISGAGKSRIINVLFNEYRAESIRSTKSVTKEVSFYYGELHSGSSTRRVCIVDVIGFCDNSDLRQPEELVKYLTGKIKNSVDHYNKIFIVNKDRINTQAAANIQSVLSAIGAAQKDCVHVILTGMEFQKSEVRLRNCQEVVTDKRFLPLIKHSDVKLASGGNMPRVACVGFLDDDDLLKSHPGFRQQFMVDRDAIFDLVTYPSEAHKPDRRWSLCVLL